MGAIAALEPTSLHVQPGEQVTATLRVRNAGSVVDEFTFDILGDAGAWTTADPEVLRLLPGDEEQVTLTLAPPRSAEASAGETPFGVKVTPKEDPDGSVVEEGVVTVAPFVDVTAELLPRTSHGRRRGRHELAIDNRGNDLLNADVIPRDENDQLEFEVDDPGMVLEPGRAQFTGLDVRPQKRFWRGPEKTLPFEVLVQSPNGVPPVTVEGTMVQKPLLPKWLGKALLALLALLLLLALLWYTLLRPTIETAAEDAAVDAAEEAAPAAASDAVNDALEGPLADQQGQTDQQQDQIDSLIDEVGEHAVILERDDFEAPTTVSTPTDERLEASASDGGGTATDDFTIPTDATFELTDVVLQNPDGNRGRLVLSRDGDPLIEVALENFRDLDYHFVVPVVFEGEQSIQLQLTCDEVTAEGEDECSAAAYISGNLVEPTSGS